MKYSKDFLVSFLKSRQEASLLTKKISKALAANNVSLACTYCRKILARSDYPAPIRSYASRILNKYDPLFSGQLAFKQFYEKQQIIACNQNDLRVYAFYLPQFHEIAENNKWWGDGFTEWTNTKKSQKRFPSHYQPREPHADIGYYDLSSPDALRNQVAIARRSGITGFCFYYYWFSGKKLLETPIENFINSKDIDFEFTICWANENWTRRWDGMDSEVLINQNYDKGWENDFIASVSVYLCDRRCLKLFGKPVIIIYKPSEIPSLGKVILSWKAWCRENGVGEISVWAVHEKDCPLSSEDERQLDRYVEFPPRQVAALENISPQSIGCNDHEGHFFDYKILCQSIRDGLAVIENTNKLYYRCAMMGWDNSARRKKGFSVWLGFDNDEFYNWIKHIVGKTSDRLQAEERLLFVNAWNEWGEGTYLEPDKKFGYASINALVRALNGLPNQPLVLSPNKDGDIGARLGGAILVHVHVYNWSVLGEIASYIKNIPCAFDVALTYCNGCPSDEFLHTDLFGVGCGGIFIRKVPNVGRDLSHFIILASEYASSYDLILHLHTKESPTVWWGGLWRRYLLRHVLGNSLYLKSLLAFIWSNPDVGIVSPPIYPALASHISWGKDSDKKRCQDLLNRCFGEASNVPALPDIPSFAAGSFFWARTQALKPLFDLGINYNDFEAEDGQVSSTFSHCIERVLPYIARAGEYSYEQVVNRSSLGADLCIAAKKRRVCVYVFYSMSGSLSSYDSYYVEKLASSVDKFIVVVNGELSAEAEAELKVHADMLILRQNKGFDFGAWKEALVDLDFLQSDDFDNLILANSSCVGPFIPWTTVYAEMDARDFDFWGLTIYPDQDFSGRPEAVATSGKISRHVQSYFVCFSRKVCESSVFEAFWKSLDSPESLLDAVVSCEIKLTSDLAASGFRYGAYCEDHESLQDHYSRDPSFNAIYSRPYDMLMAGSPVFKNKFQYMDLAQFRMAREFLRSSSDYPAAIIEDWPSP